MLLKKDLSVDRKVKVFVSTVEKEGHFAKDASVQLVGESVVSVASVDTMLSHYAASIVVEPLCYKGGRIPKFGKLNTTSRRGGRHQSRGKGGQVNFVEGPLEPPGENDSFAFTVEQQTCNLAASAEPVICVSIWGVNRDFLVDSGSGSNLINMDTVKELRQQGLNIQLQPCTRKLYAYGGRALEIEGQFQLEVCW